MLNKKRSGKSLFIMSFGSTEIDKLNLSIKSEMKHLINF